MIPVRPRKSPNVTSADYPMVLNTGRVRDHWHTMTRSAKSTRLSQHIAEPYVEIHPEDAAAYGLAPADIAQIDSPHGQMLARVQISDRTPPGIIFTPMHWTGQWSAKGRTDAVVAPEVDPISGQPELKRTAVSISKVAMNWYGFGISTTKPNFNCDYWALAQIDGGWRYEMAGKTAVPDWQDYTLTMLGLQAADPILIRDRTRATTRLALLQDGRVQAAFFIAPEPVAVSRSYLSTFLAGDADDPLQALSGRAGAGRPDPGAVVCTCFNVGINTIRNAIQTQGLANVEAIGAALQAGTNCGSCRPELKALLETAATPIAAE